ncbi:hypothetical protein KIN20_015285 [Parelaphostrongylus tenuis]|uniref:Nose resistant-to-fluoxetine protein N-terminal domain-containing protein n=1 Tax=Parelaphostrongylus tenuis TaxID=148309 RepID=A0AAD5MIB7_PARTN|nr:hypothetical protein KIN20_015285 [Parelaphostrongylus tenuis]
MDGCKKTIRKMEKGMRDYEGKSYVDNYERTVLDLVELTHSRQIDFAEKCEVRMDALRIWTLSMLLASAAACSLCPLRVPPRPRPLDQYKLPTIPNLNLETMPVFCNFSRELLVDEECRSGFENLLCTTDETMDSLICNGQAESIERCSSCAKKWHDSKWALSWWDSLGKPAAGVSDGNYYWLGDYELCSQLRIEGKFDGKYCRVELEIPDSLVEEGCPQTDPLAIVLGVCMPSSCTDDQLHRLAERDSSF